VIVRAATAEDLPGVRNVARVHGHVFDEGRRDSVDHELEHGRLVVAADGDGVIGFGAVVERDGVAYLADLFLLHDRLGQGIGSAIMRALFPARGERYTFASSDPRALPLYVRHGMRPLMPLLYLRGDAAAAARLPDPGLALQEAGDREIEQLDAEAFGRSRPEDHAFMSAIGPPGLVAHDETGTVGYGYVRVGRRPDGPRALLNPSGSTTASGLARTTFALLRHASTLAPAANVAVLGTHPGLPDLLAAGYRVEDLDTYMATRPDLLDGTRYGPSPTVG
jgi:GNAT superfamily N-acetyltransferase